MLNTPAGFRYLTYLHSVTHSFACILLNFYTAWEVCLFSVLYFFWYWATSQRLEGRSAKLLGRRFGAFAEML